MSMKRFLSMAIVSMGLSGFVPTLTAADIQDLIDVERQLFTDLKYYLGVVSAENAGAQNLLQYMWPPYFDITQAMGSNMLPAEQMGSVEQEQRLRDFANYNIYTPKQSADNYYGARLAYCGKTDKNNIQACEYKNPGVGNDVLAYFLLDKLGYANATEENAALQYIINLSNPKPFDFDPAKVYENKEDPSDGITVEGKKYFNMAFRQQPALTVAQNSLLAIFAERKRIADVAKDLPIGSNGAASFMEMINFEASRRYANADWSDAMNKLSQAGILREIANMQALQIYLDVKKYEQSSRMEALMAAQVALLSQLNGQGAQAEAVGSEINSEELMNQTIGQ